MALPGHLISWLNEGDSSHRLQLYLISERIFDRLRERGASQAEIDETFRSLAPSEFNEFHGSREGTRKTLQVERSQELTLTPKTLPIGAGRYFLALNTGATTES